MLAPPFYLRKHAFFCRSGTHYVILDAKRDDYICLDTNEFESLALHLDGWKPGAVQRTSAVSHDGGDASSIARNLVAREILSTTPSDSKPAMPIEIPLATRSLDDSDASNHPVISAKYLFQFVSAITWANRMLTRHSFSTIVSVVTARKQNAAKHIERCHLERAAALFAIFNRLRPTYPRKWICLFDSLALLRFYSYHNLFPTWVFGVVAEPFEAHCWLQYDGAVLNDNLQRVSKFEPIMAV